MMSDYLSIIDENVVLPEGLEGTGLENLVTTSEYEELVETFGPFGGEQSVLKVEKYAVDVQTSIQDPQTAFQNGRYHDPLATSVNELQSNIDMQQIDFQSSQFGDPAMMLVPSMPSPTGAMPSTDEYPGPYDFEIQIDSRFWGKKWLFSHDMNKLFIAINTPIHLGFKCDPVARGLTVRALPVFLEAEAFQEPVVRCLHHQCLYHPVNKGVDPSLVNHVLHVVNPNANYDFDERSERFSVCVPLDPPQPGTDWVTVAFKFMCKTSCMSGMNRRPIEVIFTLENNRGAVVGRRKMKVRICSCPKRDKNKEENDSEAKQNHASPRGKKLQIQLGKKRKSDVFQQTFLGMEHFMDGTIYAKSRLLRKLRIEKREPNEKEATLLKKYDSDIDRCTSSGN